VSRLLSVFRSACRRVAQARLTLIGLILASVATPLLAEVSILTDARGRYLRTLILCDVRGSQRLVWSQVRQGVNPSALLNVHGDRWGDSVPFIRDQPGRRQPWVIWSAGDGHDKEIAFSTWLNGRWQTPQLLESVDNLYDDLGPRLAFDAKGRPVAVWWRNDPVPRVYLSVYGGGVWSRPLLISDVGTPSRFPSVAVTGSQAAVTFYTPRGQTVLFQDLDAMAAGAVLEGNGPMDGPVPPPDSWTVPPPADPSTSHPQDGGLPGDQGGEPSRRPSLLE